MEIPADVATRLEAERQMLYSARLARRTAVGLEAELARFATKDAEKRTSARARRQAEQLARFPRTRKQFGRREAGELAAKLADADRAFEKRAPRHAADLERLAAKTVANLKLAAEAQAAKCRAERERVAAEKAVAERLAAERAAAAKREAERERLKLIAEMAGARLVRPMKRAAAQLAAEQPVNQAWHDLRPTGRDYKLRCPFCDADFTSLRDDIPANGPEVAPGPAKEALKRHVKYCRHGFGKVNRRIDAVNEFTLSDRARLEDLEVEPRIRTVLEPRK